MRSAIQRVVDEITFTYPDLDQRRRILDYSSSVPGRLQAACAIHAVEDAVCGQVVAALKSQFPEFESRHPEGWSKGMDDLAMLSRTCVQAMLHDSQDYLDEKALALTRQVLALAAVDPQFIRLTYETLIAAYSERLEANHFVLIEPYLSHILSTLSSIPQPAKA